MEKLLEKSRKINYLLQKTGAKPVDFTEMANVLMKTIECNVYIVDKEGKIPGYGILDDFGCGVLEEEIINTGLFSEISNQGLLKHIETEANIVEKGDKCIFKKEDNCIFPDKLITVIPVIGGGERLATLVLVRSDNEFTCQDLILGEYGASVVGMEILRSRNEYIEKEARKKATVQIAIDTLSYSEMRAMESILEELNDSEGLVIASNIAEKVGITRSVIVNALRKFESAGVIRSRSLGMKGTYIKILNKYLLDEIDRLRI